MIREKNPNGVAILLFCTAVDPGVEKTTFSQPMLGWKGQHPYLKVQAVLKFSLECVCFRPPGGNDAEGIPRGTRRGAEMGDSHVLNGNHLGQVRSLLPRLSLPRDSRQPKASGPTHAGTHRLISAARPLDTILTVSC